MSQAVSDEAFASHLNQIGLATMDQLEEARGLVSSAAASGKLISLGDALVLQNVLSNDQKALIEKKLASQQQGGVSTLGNFKLLKKLGEGGMGAVYLAEDMTMLRKVALKVLPPSLANNPEFLKRFRREAKAAGRLNHVNIVSAFTVGEELGNHFYVMEFCEGEPLDKILKRERVLSWDRVVEIAIQVARGLQHAHEHDLIHRDIKPANIFITSTGVAKVLDMGLSKEVGSSDLSFNTQTGMALGTPHYVSPEQARGEKNIDGRVDIYSLGATMYHLLTGQTPFDGSSPAMIILKHMTDQIPNPQDIQDNIPDGVVLVLQKMMAKEAADRYANCTELLRDLELVIDGKMPECATMDIGKSSVAMANTARRAGGVARKGRTAGPLPAAGTKRNEAVAERRGHGHGHGAPVKTAKSNTILYVYGGGGLAVLILLFAILKGGPKPETVAKKDDPPAKPSEVVKPPVVSPTPAPPVVNPTPTPPVVKPPTPTPVVALQPTFSDSHRSEVKVFVGHSEWVAGIDLSADAKIAVSGSKDKTIRIWNAETGEQLRVLEGHTNLIHGVALSPDAKFIASGGQDQSLRLWDAVKGAPIRNFENVNSVVNGVVFSPDGAYVAAALESGELGLWETETGKPKWRIKAHQGHTMGVAISSDGKKLLTGGADRFLKLWDATNQTLIKSMSGHTADVFGVAFSRDGKRAASGSDDASVRTWDLEKGQQIAICRGHSKRTWGVAFLPDGRSVLSAAEDRTVRLWNAETGNEIHRFDVGADGGDLVLTRDGKRFIVGLMDRTMRLWSLDAAAQSLAAQPK